MEVKTAAKRLHKQQRFYIEYIIRGILLAGIGLAGGILVPINGIGKSVNFRSEGIYEAMQWLEERNISSELLLAGVFYILAIIGVFTLYRGLKKAAASHTKMGESILTQAKNYESIKEMIASIDADLERGSNIYDTVYVGREWILSEQAMRLSNVCGIFKIEADKNDFALALVDDQQNVWGAGFDNKEYLDKAYRYLTEKLPDAVRGDYNAYMEFLGEQTNIQETMEEAAAAKERMIPSDVTLCLIKPDGIPTSNFTWEDIQAYIIDGKRAALSVAGGSVDCAEGLKFFELSCEPMNTHDWNVRLRYQKDKIRYQQERETFDRGEVACTAVKTVDQGTAEDILRKVLEQRRLPEFLTWEEENA